MEFKELKRILELIKAQDIAEFELQDGEFRLSTKMKSAVEVVQVHSAPAPVAAPVATAAPESPSAPAAPRGLTVDSPMVGTFYRASSPDSESFVKVGDVVEEDTVVCIIEAMKVMNEIKAEKRGKIVKALVENGEAVEFGQALFEISPA